MSNVHILSERALGLKFTTLPCASKIVAPSAENSTDPCMSFVNVATDCKDWCKFSSSNTWTSYSWLFRVVDVVAEEESVEELGRRTLRGEWVRGWKAGAMASEKR